jgi:hypothetical protein
MKTKVVQFAVSCLIVMSNLSCNKKYTCVCTNPGGKTTAFQTKTSKSQAEKQCQEYYDSNFGSIPLNETFCEIE